MVSRVFIDITVLGCYFQWLMVVVVVVVVVGRSCELWEEEDEEEQLQKKVCACCLPIPLSSEAKITLYCEGVFFSPLDCRVKIRESVQLFLNLHTLSSSPSLTRLPFTINQIVFFPFSLSSSRF